MDKFKAFLSKVWAFLNSHVFLYCLIIVAILLLAKACANYKESKRENEIINQNLAAKTDSIKMIKTKNGGLEASIAGYISSVNNLKNLNKSLDSLSKAEKGQILSINNVIFQLKQDTTQLRDHLNFLESSMDRPIKLSDSTYKISWTLRYDWDKLNYDIYKGQTFVSVGITPGFVWRDGLTNDQILDDAFILNHNRTEITSVLSQIDLTFGQKVENKQLRVFVTTTHPRFTAKSLEGVLIDPNTSPYIKQLMKK